MDNTDLNIINILQKNGRSTIKEIGGKVGLTSPAVTERIRRLEGAGVITGYAAELDLSKMGKGISAYVNVDVYPKKYDLFCKFCEETDAIIEHHHIIGVHNSLLRVSVENSSQLESLLGRIKDYGISQTSVLLKSYFKHKDIK
ncbi:Lrp/AsnC family transcriptional regulator [Aminipila terrae]|uniref:Winged helix-turn-helix transcriptional regulator n=1 Tax=Aminipila terrae TaxID=2697030 RepID=A0A6P1ML12_9FIRM|nr:Lrp/AsnC family transcriptional regulator [Aminipila terrae]QHI72336.1 winged helix-turn-helix transcriptional regulator [Aminipila terrae]